ncbi:MAG: response regulator transcription factor [Anaerocolumna sp.]
MEVKPFVLVIEDENAIRNFITAILESNGYQVMKANTGKEAISMAISYSPDIILLDLGLPDMDGVQVLKSIREWSKIPIVVVSARGHEREKVEVLDLGADDYIVKPFGTSELLARIRTALRHSSLSMGGEFKGVEKLTIGELSVDYGRRTVLLSGSIVHLTPVEYKILALLSKHAGKVLTHDYIMREIWGLYAGDSHTLRVNMANIRRKIEINPGTPKYILTEMGVGYRMVEALEDRN